MIITGCGILPICLRNNKLHALCGIQKNKIWDLGGRIEQGETAKQCAAREFYEESVSLVDSYENLLHSKIYYVCKLRFHGKSYISYVIKTQFIDVEEKYKSLIDYIREHDSKPVKMNFSEYNLDKLYSDNIYPLGYFELEEMKWIPLDDLIEMAKNKDKIISYRLRNIIYQLPDAK